MYHLQCQEKEVHSIVVIKEAESVIRYNIEPKCFQRWSPKCQKRHFKKFNSLNCQNYKGVKKRYEFRDGPLLQNHIKAVAGFSAPVKKGESLSKDGLCHFSVTLLIIGL